MPDIKFWEQYGPWTVLAVVIIFAVGAAGWKIYVRMANALDEHHRTLMQLSENHAKAIAEMNEKLITCVNNNTIALTSFRDELEAIKERMGKLEDR